MNQPSKKETVLPASFLLLGSENDAGKRGEQIRNNMGRSVLEFVRIMILFKRILTFTSLFLRDTMNKKNWENM